MKRAVLAVLLTGVSPACVGPPVVAPPVKTASNASAPAMPPAIEELKNATYTHLGPGVGEVTLANGRWTGAPVAGGAASRPTVALADEFRIEGDLDRDGILEAVVALTITSGGTGVVSVLAVVQRQNGKLHQIATATLGDRVQLRSARIADGSLFVSAVRTGENDAACCPGELVDWQWTLRDGRLIGLRGVRTGRLSVETLAGTMWVLRRWDLTEPAPAAPVVTLAYEGGRFTGESGCNRYFAEVVPGQLPGEVALSRSGGTRMACPEPPSSVEKRFLEQLGAARTVGFRLGRLAISYVRGDGSPGTMLFDAGF